MTPKMMDAVRKPCTCGGRLYISKRKKQRSFIHLAIKCEKCGAWYGGFTIKEKGEDNAT